MKKVFSLLAVVILATGLFSCESDNPADTETLLQSLEQQARTGGGGGSYSEAEDPDEK